jgi:Domain of unknown function (DUF4192)
VSSTGWQAGCSPAPCGGRKLPVMDISLPALKTPTDVLAVVPYLLGFVPERSVVVMGMRARRLVFQARSDVPRPEDVGSVTRHLATIVARQRVDAALIVAYGTGPDVTPTVVALRHAIDVRGIDVVEALRADDGRYWSYLCRSTACCLPEGTPYDVGATMVAAEATYAGISPAASRTELVARLAPVRGLARIAMREAAERADSRLDRLLASTADAEVDGPDAVATATRDALFSAGVAAVDAANALIGAIAPLDDDAVAWLALVLISVRVRDYAWERIGRDIEGSVALWTDVVRRVEPELAAPPATLLAFAAWRNGDGAVAAIALDRALDADSSYPMARLLGDALDNGIAPGAWLDVPSPSPRSARPLRRHRGRQRRTRVVPRSV